VGGKEGVAAFESPDSVAGPFQQRRRRGSDGGVVLDLTTATSIRVIGIMGATEIFDRAVTGSALGVITMPWQTTDTDAVGRIVVETEVTWPGAKPQTFRPNETVEILADLG